MGIELSIEEKAVLRALADAYNLYSYLKGKTKSETDEFYAGIHMAQSQIACRVARRVDPSVWNQN